MSLRKVCECCSKTVDIDNMGLGVPTFDMSEDGWSKLVFDGMHLVDLCDECTAKVVKGLGLKVPSTEERQAQRGVAMIGGPRGFRQRGPMTGLSGALTEEELKQLGLKKE